jgi:hypothetical protein
MFPEYLNNRLTFACLPVLILAILHFAFKVF